MSYRSVYITIFIAISFISSQPTFTDYTISISADGVNTVFAVDLDGDSDLDVVSASYNDDKIAWYENDGSEIFTEHVISTSADGVISAYPADVDGDGDMDVLSASFEDGQLPMAWYENDGTGNFTVQGISTTVNGAWVVHAADVDGDGDMDVLSGSVNDNTIAWYENNGSENFTQYVISASIMGVNSIYVADVDGDGDMDVLSASSNDSKIVWHENDGSENFTEYVISTSADGANTVYVVDLDGDSDLDVLSASYNDDKIAWYENDGSENFTEHVISTIALGARSVYAADVDGDGEMDVLSGSVNDNKIAWYENDGSENFTEHVISTIALGVRSVYAVDLDGDSDLDVLSASYNDDKITWYEQDGSPVQTTYVPDDNFEQALIDLGYDDVLDDYVLTENISGVTYLDVDDKGISDLTGIEGFTAVTDLLIRYNQLTSLNVSNNPALTWLSCDENQLTVLDVSNNTVLTRLTVNENQLTTIDVSNNTALEYFVCGNNQLTSLDVSNNTSLYMLDCTQNQLTTLDLNNIIDLEQLYAPYNQFVSLDLSNNTDLTRIDVYGNQLTSLDLSNNTVLTNITFGENQMTSLDLSNNPALTELYCRYNSQLTSLDLSNNTALTTLWVFNNNQLTGLLQDLIAPLTSLNELRLQNNQLSGFVPSNICDLNINFSDPNSFNISNNNLCQPYPLCVADYVGEQDCTTGAGDIIQMGGDIDGEDIGDHFGRVSISSDGTIVAIGAPNNDGGGEDAGHVRVYEYSGGEWLQLGSDIDGEAVGDFSGNSVSLSSDGTIVAIGAIGNDGNGDDAGHVRVFEYSGSDWVQLGSDIDGEAGEDLSGNSVSLSSDGTIVAIGATGNDGTGDDAGHVRVFEYIGSDWVQLGSDIDGEDAGDESGHSLSLSSDGTIVAIGAVLNFGTGSHSGHVRIYEYDGSDWVQMGSDIDAESEGDYSGSLSISSNGTIVAVGSMQNDGSGENAGHVRIYEYNGSDWVQMGNDIDGETEGDFSGENVSISSDGTIVAIGAKFNDDNGENSGHVRVFEYIGSDWVQFGSDIDGEDARDFSGIVFLNSSGSILAIGAHGPIFGDIDRAGCVRVYSLDGTLPYTGPVWHVAGFGSDSLGNGSYGFPYGSIQKAIDISENGDTVRVSSGTYIGNINFYGKDIVVEGDGPETTIIDGNGDGSVVKFSGGETSAATLQGFTLTNGSTSTGAGIYFNNSSPTIDHVLITNNSGNYGAGIYCSSSSPMLSNVTIVSNNADIDGGAVYMRGANSNLILINSILFGNTPNTIHIANGNVSATYSDIEGGWDGNGNINAYPLFCESDNGVVYKLAENSACASSGQGGSYMGAFPVGCAAILSTETDVLPTNYVLHQNYPNPFNPTTQIRYDLPENSYVSIIIYDLMGKRVKLLVNTIQDLGYRSIYWNATNDLGQPVSAGMYIYTIQAGEFRQTRKMVLLK